MVSFLSAVRTRAFAPMFLSTSLRVLQMSPRSPPNNHTEARVSILIQSASDFLIFLSLSSVLISPPPYLSSRCLSLSALIPLSLPPSVSNFAFSVRFPPLHTPSSSVFFPLLVLSCVTPVTGSPESLCLILRCVGRCVH